MSWFILGVFVYEGTNGMKVLRHLAVSATSIALLSWGGPSVAQPQDFSKVKIQTIPVQEGVYMLMGAGGNIGVSSGKDGVFLIDDQFAPLTPKIQAAIDQITDKPVRFLLNTHWHFDHTGGNENFGKAGVVIVAHNHVRERLKTDQFFKVFDRKVPASPAAALPIITFGDTVTFHLNGQTIHAFHVERAHTDGDSVIHFREANVIHAGDTYFNGNYPFIDTEHGGSLEGMIEATERILAIANDETKIIPGHGPLSNRAELVVYRQMLLDVRSRTRIAIQKGIPLADFIASQPTADYDKTWGKGFLPPEKFLTIVYQDLATRHTP